MITSGTVFIIFILFLFQLGGFLIFMWIVFGLIAWPLRKFLGSIKKLMDVKI